MTGSRNFIILSKWLNKYPLHLPQWLGPGISSYSQNRKYLWKHSYISKGCNTKLWKTEIVNKIHLLNLAVAFSSWKLNEIYVCISVYWNWTHYLRLIIYFDSSRILTFYFETTCSTGLTADSCSRLIWGPS